MPGLMLLLWAPTVCQTEMWEDLPGDASNRGTVFECPTSTSTSVLSQNHIKLIVRLNTVRLYNNREFVLIYNTTDFHNFFKDDITCTKGIPKKKKKTLTSYLVYDHF